PPSPSSPPFPYTTLFRSLAAVDIPPNVGDFRLVDRKALNVFRQMRERDPFVRGMFAWMGFRQGVITYDRPARKVGETKYPVGKIDRKSTRLNSSHEWISY